MKPYPKYKDSGVEWIGEVPERWEVKKLKWLAKIRLSNIDKKSKERELTVELCNYVDVYYNDSITSKIEFMKATARQDQIDILSLEEGDILITKDSESPDDIAVPAYVPSSLHGVVCGYHLAHIRPYEKHANGNYLFRSFSAYGISDQFEISANGVTRFGIGKQAIDNSVFLTPPLEEQTAIAAYLDRKTAQIDNLISKKQKLIELLKEERVATINQAVTKGLNPDAPMKDSGIEWLREIPAHWEVKKLKYVSIIISKGTTPSTIGKDITARGEIRFIKAENIENNNLKPKPAFFVDEKTNDILKRSQLEKYDILFVIAGATIGKVAVLTDEFLPANTNQAVSFIRLKPYVNVKFIWYWLQSSRINELTWLNAVQSAQPNLSMENLGNFCVTYPTGSQQDEIVFQIESETTKTDQIITKIKKQIDLLKEYRIALISNVVTGKIDVRT
ncbi:MAG: restriction endonuclease subunit S [Deltaproteobacteria bacterium]|nr:restriction endonuclease subunit S [Deltaproteobacteria bacterium]